MSDFPTGTRIRNRRMALGHTQTALAASLSISTSYLNLIEHNRRSVGGALLQRIAHQLAVPLRELTGSADAQLSQDLMEVARALNLSHLAGAQATALVARQPDWAQAVVHLYRRYQQAAETSLALGDRLHQDPAIVGLSHEILSQVTAIRSFAEILEGHADLAAADRRRFSHIVADQSSELAISARQLLSLLGAETTGPLQTGAPQEEVNDFIIAHGNHFAALEDACATLRAEIWDGTGSLSAALAACVEAHDEMPNDGIPADAGPQTIAFLQARAIVEHALRPVLDQLTIDPVLTSDIARQAARAALVRYAAAALRFPYEAVLEAAEALRYDVERLALQFGGSFEQLAQRLVSLRRPGMEGVPFAFLRADPAGNLSKPFSIPGLRMPRLGGTCALWPLHTAFCEPERPVAQLVEMPMGDVFLFVARQVRKGGRGHGSLPVRHAVMLGCNAAYLDRVVYGDGLDHPRAKPLPVGLNCRACPREGCAQRAHPPILAPSPPVPANGNGRAAGLGEARS